ncbi:WG repeat-containing protein [Paenibacillus chitinolyticus]|uniref:WG repeat-containing protein n=1 Tax=Paenibacillus chitinolyticus TaxID=79263 RepID=UPI00363AE3B2
MKKFAASCLLCLGLILGNVQEANAESTPVIAVEPQFKEGGNFSEGLAAVKIKDRAGAIDKTGKIIIQPQYDWIGEFSNGYAEAAKNKLRGIIDKTGKEIVPPLYYMVGSFKEGISIVRESSQGLSGLYDQTGKEILPPKYEMISEFHEGLAAVMNNKMWGFIDSTGAEILPLQYEEVQDFNNGLAMAKMNGKWGFIDKQGNVVVPMRYDTLYGKIQDGLMIYGNLKTNPTDEFSYEWGVMNIHTGKIIVKPKYDDITEFDKGYAIVLKNRKQGLIDTSGKEVVPVSYPYISYVLENRRTNLYKDGVHIVFSKDKFGVFNESDPGKKLKMLDYASVSYSGEGIILGLGHNKKWEIVNQEGVEILPPKYDLIRGFQEGLSVAQAAGKWGFIDKAGTETVALQYEAANSFSEGLAAVKKEGKWGFIDRAGNPIIPIQYEDVRNFSESLAAVKWNGKWGYIRSPLDVPADWAKPEVETALALKLIPDDMQNAYAQNITRSDFSRLVVHLMAAKTGQSMEQLVKAGGKSMAASVFKDTSDPILLAANALGIINGKAEGVFDPSGTITRQEASVMLARTAKILGIYEVFPSADYADSADIATWAVEAVAYGASVTDPTNHAKLMGEMENNKFAPYANFTRQQAFITAKRLFNSK